MLLKKPGFQSLGDLYLRPKLERLLSPLRIQVDQFVTKVDLAKFQIQDRPVSRCRGKHQDYECFQVILRIVDQRCNLLHLHGATLRRWRRYLHQLDVRDRSDLSSLPSPIQCSFSDRQDLSNAVLAQPQFFFEIHPKRLLAGGSACLLDRSCLVKV